MPGNIGHGQATWAAVSSYPSALFSGRWLCAIAGGRSATKIGGGFDQSTQMESALESLRIIALAPSIRLN
jgi:hypothetical protein